MVAKYFYGEIELLELLLFVDWIEIFQEDGTLEVINKAPTVPGQAVKLVPSNTGNQGLNIFLLNSFSIFI